MSTPRPSGGVRSLRAMFENSEAASPEPRGRSPAASATSETSLSRPTSKIRASFVSVDSPSGFLHRESSAARSNSRSTELTSPLAQRRESFSLQKDSEALDELKKTMSNEIEERRKSVDVKEVVPEHAIDSGPSSTPAIQEMDEASATAGRNEGSGLSHVFVSRNNIEPVAEIPQRVPAAEPLANKTNAAELPSEVKGAVVNPDKPTSVAEETPAIMKPSDVTDAAAVSGGEALAAPQEPLPSLSSTSAPVNDAPTTDDPSSKDTKPVVAPTATKNGTKPPVTKSNGASTIAEAKSKLKSAATTKPSAISTSKATGSQPSVKSPPAPSPKLPAAAPKTASSKPVAPATKAPRQSMAPVTSPTGKHRLSSSTSTGGFAKPKPKSPTRTVNLPSHLVKPTASSAAKDAAAAPPASTTRTAAPRDRTSSIKPPVAAVKKQNPRQSLPAQPAKRPESRTSTAAPSGSFLERMMRPTASSSSKTHDKPEVKSPPRSKPAPPKAKAAPAAGTASKVKAKVGEGVAKIKDKVTSNGADHHEESTVPAEPAVKPSSEVVTETPTKSAAEEASSQPSQGEATPDVTSTDLTAETPNFEGATIR